VTRKGLQPAVSLSGQWPAKLRQVTICLLPVVMIGQCMLERDSDLHACKSAPAGGWVVATPCPPRAMHAQNRASSLLTGLASQPRLVPERLHQSTRLRLARLVAYCSINRSIVVRGVTPCVDRRLLCRNLHISVVLCTSNQKVNLN
jgi:hypothetical protein